MTRNEIIDLTIYWLKKDFEIGGTAFICDSLVDVKNDIETNYDINPDESVEFIYEALREYADKNAMTIGVPFWYQGDINLRIEFLNNLKN